MNEVLAQKRLERYIEAIYMPETKRASHDTWACLRKQYDALVWLNETSALTPLRSCRQTKKTTPDPLGSDSP